MNELRELDDLLDRIEMPPTDVGADVARGRGALRRRHRLQTSATALSVAAVAAAGVAMSGGTGPSGAGGPSYVGQETTPHRPSHHASHRPRGHATTAPRGDVRAPLPGTPGLDTTTLRRYHRVLAEHLDPAGDQLRLAQNEQGGGSVFGTKLDWRGGGMLEIVVGRTWSAANSFYGLDIAGMAPTTFRGRPARVSSAGSDLVVSVRHHDGTVVTLIASTSFGNNGTTTASLDLTPQQLLAAAADPRLQLPAYLR